MDRGRYILQLLHTKEKEAAEVSFRLYCVYELDCPLEL